MRNPFVVRFARLAALFFIFLFVAVPQITLAAAPVVKISDPRYAAVMTAQSLKDPVAIKAGQSISVTFSFKNTGTVTWDNTGKNYLSAYTMEPRDRSSAFKGAGWVSAKQTAKMTGVVKPGQTGKLTVSFKAPNKAGTYTEKFYLAAENKTWVKGGYFFVKFNVTGAATSKPSTDLEEAVPGSEDEQVAAISANRFFLGQRTLTGQGGTPISFMVGYQNTGSSAWNNYRFVLASATGTNQSVFADSSWVDGQTAINRSAVVGVNGYLRDTLTLRLPAQAGSYTAAIDLLVNGQRVPGATIFLPVTVTAGAPSGYVIPSFGNAIDSLANQIPRLTEEPTIRVGLWKPDGDVYFLSDEDDYQIYQGTTLVSTTLPRGYSAQLTFDGTDYSLKAGDIAVTGPDYIRLVPATNQHAVFVLTNFDRPISGRTGVNFNKYRGAMELRQARDAEKNLYVINELLMEDYVNGIGENANGSPIEYLKAQAVAQRTYAYYTMEYTAKYKTRYFDVVAHTGDQLYLGYNSEQRMTNFVSAAQATRGYMVTYNSEIVITPYFGNADTHTRSWTEVWGGKEKPWLVPVATIYDDRANKKLFGHGVGMSQRDAAYRADETGADFISLLKYYYTGVDVSKIY